MPTETITAADLVPGDTYIERWTDATGVAHERDRLITSCQTITPDSIWLWATLYYETHPDAGPRVAVHWNDEAVPRRYIAVDEAVEVRR